MAEVNATEDRIVNQIAQDTGDDSLAVQQDETAVVPVYKKMPDSIRPVSKSAGGLWKSRHDGGLAKLDKSGKKSNWEEAIRYYKNDQSKNRTGAARRLRRDRADSDSENIVFANTSALVPSVYAKNPVCEVTSNVRDDDQEGGPDNDLINLASVSQRLVNTLSNRKGSPGINLKPKARKCVVMATLTNLAYIEIGYTMREQSSEQALADLDDISKRLVDAKDQKEIEQCEGELMALEESIDFLRPSGPWAKFKHPMSVIRDPDAMESDLTDSKWVMYSDFVATAYINAVYREKTGDNEWKNIYKPTHVVSINDAKGVQDEINSFSLLKSDTDYKNYGYNDDQGFKKACLTKVWYVWDKITRRVYMFNDEDWSWPIWVWDDPYGLDTFFPLYPLEFYTDPEDDIGASEVQYYLDQQDSINENNAEKKKIRNRIINGLFYNKNIIKQSDVIDAYLSGGVQNTAVGVDAPADADLQKAFFTLLPPSVQFVQLLDNKPHYDAVQRVSSVLPIMQGEQFKTNTTNDQVDTYNSQQQTRLDEKIDAVEDFIGGILWGVLQLCLQFMTSDEVASVIGEKDAQLWTNMNPDDIRKNFSVRVVGGSSQKPTSKAKKQEAIQMGQVLGQYANAGQGAALILTLKVMERAFDEVVITKNDWEFLRSAITQSIQNSNPQGQPQQPGSPPQPGPNQPAPGPQPGPPEGPIQQLLAQIDQLPPEAKAALGTALARGVPMEEALPRIFEVAQQAAAGSA